MEHSLTLFPLGDVTVLRQVLILILMEHSLTSFVPLGCVIAESLNPYSNGTLSDTV